MVELKTLFGIDVDEGKGEKTRVKTRSGNQKMHKTQRNYEEEEGILIFIAPICALLRAAQSKLQSSESSEDKHQFTVVYLADLQKKNNKSDLEFVVKLLDWLLIFNLLQSS